MFTEVLMNMHTFWAKIDFVNHGVQEQYLKLNYMQYFDTEQYKKSCKHYP